MAMQAIVDQILEGKYDYENSSLDFSCAKIELSLHKGDIYEGSFHVYSSGNGFTQGYVNASDMRMECVTREFNGNGEEIFFRFHAENLNEGEVIKGNFYVISNQGEYYLPFVVSIEHSAADSSVGHVKNLFHFANLAKSNWREAVNLFYTPYFTKLFEGGDRQYYECYRGLSAYRGNEQNVEEFLIQINKKQKNEFLVRESEIEKELDNTGFGVIESELHIVKNGWGYTALQVECDGAFLFTEKEFLGENDFLGNRCTLPVFIDSAQCREGKNFGTVYLYNSYVSITIPVTVISQTDTAAMAAYHQKKREIVKVMEYYQDFRMKKIGSAEWMQETEKLVDSMIAREDDDIAARLFKAQILISKEQYNEADWTLNHAADLLESMSVMDDVLYAYYLYLTTLLERRETYVNEVTKEVEKLYARNRDEWRIAWLLLYLSEDYNKTPVAKWEFLEKQFRQGCASPAFYIEALHLYNTNPTLLRKLDETAMQILYYGARKDAIGPELAEQVLYLAGRTKDFSRVLLKTLQCLYRKNADERLLLEICTLLVRGNCVGPKYCFWYEAGVEAQLRITNLYEYYMMSIELSDTQKLPRIVLMYFAYQNNLDLKHSAFLYWYVEQHKLELGDLYDSYRPRIEHFIVDQIQKERINKHLAYLYQKLLTPPMIQNTAAKSLSKLLFAHRIKVTDFRLKKVIVCQPGLVKENSYPLQNGVAYVPIYDNESAILFEDAYGNRFAKSVEYTFEKLMIPGKYLRLVAAGVTDCKELDLYLLDNDQAAEQLSEETNLRMVRVAADEEISEPVRRKLYLKLLKIYFDADNLDALDACLDTIPMELFDVTEHAEIMRYLVFRGKNEEAWKWIAEYGPYYVEPKTLLRLLDDRMAEMDSEDPEVTDLCLYSFRQGKYDSNIISYLAAYAEGPTKELRDIWKLGRSFEMDVHDLSERIIYRMLYSGVYVGEKMDIFAYYVEGGVNDRLEEVFLARCAYDYFVKERLTERIVFTEIAKMANEKEEVLKVCKLAFLKYYAENQNEMTDSILLVVREFLHEILAERIHLNFMRNFLDKPYIQEPLLLELMDKTIVEYRAATDAKVMLHYVVMHEDGEASEYLTEPMREVYGGLCYKEFVLFFGESLQYYITEEYDGEEQLTESGNLQKSDMNGKSADGRFELINDILISHTLEDYDTLDGLLDEYHRLEYLGENLFALQ